MDNNNRTEYGIFIDPPFIMRIWLKWLFAICCIASIMGVISYMAYDYLHHEIYYASAVVSVVSKENTAGALDSWNYDAAVTRNLNMWNSNILMKTIKDKNPDVEIKGNLSASIVDGAGLIRLSTSAETAQDAYYLLSEAIECYKDVNSSFDQRYYSRVITRVASDSIGVYHPRSKYYGIAAAVLVVLGSLGILFLWAIITDVLHDEAQAKTLLEMPVYESLIKVWKPFGVKAILMTQQDIKLDYLEALDKLTSRVEQDMHGSQKKALMITSIRENEGKTTVATNLAMNLSRRGNKTLLVDMDFRKPGICRILDMEEEGQESLSTLVKESQILKDHIKVREDLWDLHVLWQFVSEEDADQLLENDFLASQIEQLKEEYDFIILDTPPIGPVRDAEAVAAMADASLIVIREEFNRASVINDVNDQLEEYDAACMGAVLNQCLGRKRRKRIKYNYHYHDSYHRGIREEADD